MLFQLDEVKPPDGGDAGAICDVFVEYVFPGPDPCLPWAHQDSSFNAMIEEHDGLFITPAGEYGSRAGCYGDAFVPFNGDGVVVEVSDVLRGDKGEYTALALSLDRSISMSNSQLIYQNNNGTNQFMRLLYSPDAMRYWRLRPDSTRMYVIAEYSDDGIDWTMLGVPMATPNTLTTTVALHAGFNNLQNQGEGRAGFRRLLICN